MTGKTDVKKPLEIKVLQKEVEFVVQPLDDDMKGKAGDDPMEDILGDLYLCDKG